MRSGLNMLNLIKLPPTNFFFTLDLVGLFGLFLAKRFIYSPTITSALSLKYLNC